MSIAIVKKVEVAKYPFFVSDLELLCPGHVSSNNKKLGTWDAVLEDLGAGHSRHRCQQNFVLPKKLIKIAATRRNPIILRNFKAD